MNLDRILIEKIENRILVGIVAFVGVMVLVGWVAINEPARMAAFEDQFEGRSVERGGKLFNQNCSTCHGVNGYGLAGRAPALNSPHLFGYDFVAEERAARDSAAAQLRDLEAEQESIEGGIEAIDTTVATGELAGDELDNALARRAELEIELAEVNNLIPEAEAAVTEAESAFQAAVDANLSQAVASGYDAENPSRAGQIGWTGTTRSYIYTTLVHGRPGSVAYWPNAQPAGMVAWGQESGGPLRDDQLEDLTSYIMNWDKGNAWTLDDLNTVQQFAKVPADPANLPVGGEAVAFVGTDTDEILVELGNFTGDPVNGQAIYNGVNLGCSSCHANAIAPATELTWQSAASGADGRPHSDEPERYIIESIVAPNEFYVPGWPQGAMPMNFGERITYQEMADILAYLESFDS